ncbi:asparaginase [Silvimonas soli]|uniref:asparaginase n=1 Tax=Silvimonas soli TaxID=2980100 RepID=UPI0024B35C1D|nr:asparaginase [Silvimonas soli]
MKRFAVINNRHFFCHLAHRPNNDCTGWRIFRGITVRICLLYCGGTLGMRPGNAGLEPAPGFLSEVLQASYPAVEVIEYSPLLDSSDMGPADWNRIASDIAQRAGEFDGFVVLHGTDTMAWTSSALSFMLAGLNKPVIVTGAQHPWEEQGSDAPDNVEAAIELVMGGAYRGVGVVFAGQLFQGNRVRKSDCEADAAFSSPNLPVAGRRFGSGWALVGAETTNSSWQGLQLVAADARVVRATLGPGHSSIWLAQSLLAQPLDGVVLETYGSGNVPAHPELTHALEALAQSTVVVNCTQCVFGAVQMGLYASSQSLVAAGVLAAGDMTPEAALAKLYWAAGRTQQLAERRQLFMQNIAGERTQK